MKSTQTTLGVTRQGWFCALVALLILSACDAHALSKQQASSLLLTYLQQHCALDRELIPAADPGRYQRFLDFYRTVIIASPARFPHQETANRAAGLGGTFGETDERMPLSLTVGSTGQGALFIEFCPWYTTEVQIFDLAQVDPNTERVTYGQTKTLSRLSTDLTAAGVLSASPPANAQMRLALLKRDSSGTWTVQPAN